MKFYSIYKHEDAKERGNVYSSTYSSTGGNAHYALRTSNVPRFNSMDSEPAADYTPRPISRFNSMDSEPTASVPYSISMPTGNEEICPLCHNFKSITNTTVAVTKPLNESDSESVISTPNGIEDFGQLEINPIGSDDVVKVEEAALHSDEIKTDMLSNLDLPDGSAKVETAAVGANSKDESASNVDVDTTPASNESEEEESAWIPL
jgi:hypothetical protein